MKNKKYKEWAQMSLFRLEMDKHGPFHKVEHFLSKYQTDHFFRLEGASDVIAEAARVWSSSIKNLVT